MRRDRVAERQLGAERAGPGIERVLLRDGHALAGPDHNHRPPAERVDARPALRVGTEPEPLRVAHEPTDRAGLAGLRIDADEVDALVAHRVLARVDDAAVPPERALDRLGERVRARPQRALARPPAHSLVGDPDELVRARVVELAVERGPLARLARREVDDRRAPVVQHPQLGAGLERRQRRIVAGRPRRATSPRRDDASPRRHHARGRGLRDDNLAGHEAGRDEPASLGDRERGLRRRSRWRCRAARTFEPMRRDLDEARDLCQRREQLVVGGRDPHRQEERAPIGHHVDELEVLARQSHGSERAAGLRLDACEPQAGIERGVKLLAVPGELHRDRSDVLARARRARPAAWRPSRSPRACRSRPRRPAA